MKFVGCMPAPHTTLGATEQYLPIVVALIIEFRATYEYDEIFDLYTAA